MINFQFQGFGIVLLVYINILKVETQRKVFKTKIF